MSSRHRARQWGFGLGTLCALAALGYAALWHAGGYALARLERLRCEPLRVVDRHGITLRESAGCSGWTRLADVPEVWRALVVAGEDRRFQLHAGVDLPAVARALVSNLRAGHIVSGASTLSMQLARGLFPECRGRTLRAKLQQAFWAIALERRSSKAEILEGYLNVA
ncbi:MAG TPA: biosynthetic peptidoglycan transglycosylase, partial [Polyangiales bacterium]|nr:biosynthetic peptidoglycan transglycosylase [Polyangiales bacterium]